MYKVLTKNGKHDTIKITKFLMEGKGMRCKRVLISLLAVTTIGTGAVGLTSCVGNGGGSTNGSATGHTHVWNESVSKEATCAEEGEMLYACDCGESYTEGRDFNPYSHRYEDYVCLVCGMELMLSTGLSYKLSDDGTYYVVKGIGECTDKDIAIPTSYEGLPVKEIDGWAFSDCDYTESVIIPDSVTSVGDGAFSNCFLLTNVSIGKSVTSIGDGVFSNSENIKYIDVSKKNAHYSSLNGNLYNKDQTKLIQYAIDKEATSFTIPDSVTSIGSRAFFCCDSLRSVTIPDSVTSIGDEAFYWCYRLTSVTIPDTVTDIGASAFYDCSGLTSVTIGNRVTSIGENAFYGCSDLTSVTIPDSVKSIGKKAFNACARLTSVTIGDGVTNIGAEAFLNCERLTSVAIGKRVTSIGACAFAYCKSLTSVAFNGTIAEWNAIEKGSFWNEYMPATEVVCIDGRVSIVENE